MAQAYDVIVDTPRYHYQGKAKLDCKGDVARLDLVITDAGVLHGEGVRNGKDFEVSGTGTIDEQEVTFTAKGTTWANSIDAMAQSSIGDITIYGTSTGYSAGDVLGADPDFAGRWSDA